MEARTIVAIEISSSKLKGAVCAVAERPGSRVPELTVLAVEEIRASNNVRHGRIQNVQEVSSGINEIIRKLENHPAVSPRKVQAVVLPLGGRSLCGIPVSATLHFPSEIEIVSDTIDRLKQEAIKDVISRKTIEAIVPRAFYVNNVEVKNVVGTFGKQLRGDFLLIACSNENRRNLERIKFDTIRPANIHTRLRPIALADFVLGDSEKQLGCVLVDFGAETTTISIYHDGAMNYLSTLPMGSRLITRDLMAGLSLTEERAEDFKRTLGSAIPENEHGLADQASAAEVNNF